jgi:hypothetical protein
MSGKSKQSESAAKTGVKSLRFFSAPQCERVNFRLSFEVRKAFSL